MSSTIVRRALLIAVGTSKGEAPLPGTYRDIDVLSHHLWSITGGAWEPSEITVLRDPTRQGVLAARALLNNADFAFVSFSGHGCEREVSYPGGVRFSTTCMVCADGQEVQRAELTPTQGRSVVLLDCCRVFQPTEQKTASVGATLDSRQPQIGRPMARMLFEQAVGMAQLGPELVYGCEFNGTASDQPSFTGSLVATAHFWGERSAGVMDLGEAFNGAKRLHQHVSPGHNPTISLGRGGVHRPVPFAIGNLAHARTF